MEAIGTERKGPEPGGLRVFKLETDEVRQRVL